MQRPSMVPMLLLAAYALALTACQRSAGPLPANTDLPSPAVAPAASQPPSSAAPRPIHAAGSSAAAPLPEGTQVNYDCQDGNQLTVSYTYVAAHLRWSDGRVADLSRVASPSRSDIDVDLYADSKLSLRHAARRIELQGSSAGATTCIETAASA